MTTPLHKSIKRLTQELRRDRSQMRPIIITLYPAGHIGLRLQGLRQEETIPMQVVYERAVKMRLASEEREKLEKKAAKKGMTLAHYVRVTRKRSR